MCSAYFYPLHTQTVNYLLRHGAYADLVSDFSAHDLSEIRSPTNFCRRPIYDIVSDKFDLMETQQTANAKQIKRVFSLSAPVMCDYTVVYKKDPNILAVN